MNEESIFAEALETPDPAERAAFLERACNGSPTLRQNVEALLAAYALGEFLESPAPLSDATIPVLPPTETPGAQIGRYKLLEQIGEGGMGVVYMALQEQPMRRKVALKIIKPGMDTRQVIARFEAERQALALMDHPNIARILDAGTTGPGRGQESGIGIQEPPGQGGREQQPGRSTPDFPLLAPDLGRPYFVMELVRGIPITDFCNQEGLNYRRRLELFVDVCDAVQHAHQKGVIHRDLKPSNVLVTLQDGRPLVKVIDFGVAKAVGQQLTEKTLFTGFAQLIGTPLYMSPEQAALSAVDVDTRSDVYSLGVLLYELLTGTTPFDITTLARESYDEIRRKIREDEPLRPSARISTLQANALSTVAGRQQIDTHKLSRQLRGELDWMVMKALDKDRNRRYESASAFAADVQRYLNDEPVAASPPSRMYLLRKLAQRHRAALATTSLLAVMLLAGAALSVWQALRATQASNVAQAQRRQAEANLQTAREAVDRMLLRVADERLAGVPSFEPVRRTLLEDAIEFYQRLLEQEAGNPALRLSSAQAWNKIGNLQMHLGRWSEVQPAFEKSFAILEDLMNEAPDQKVYIKELAEGYQGFIFFVKYRLGSAEAAEAILLRAIPLRSKLTQMEPDEDEHPAALLWLQRELDEVQESLGRVSLSDGAKLVQLQGDLRRWEELVRRRPDNVRNRVELAAAHLRIFHFQENRNPHEAERIFRTAETVYTRLINDAPSERNAPSVHTWALRTVGVESFNRPSERGVRSTYAWALTGWASFLQQQGRHAEAEDAVRRAIAILEECTRSFGIVPMEEGGRALCRLQLGGYLETAERFDDAENLYRQTIEELGFHGMGQRKAAVERLTLLLLRQNRLAEAETCCRSLIDLAENELRNEPGDSFLKADVATGRRLLLELLLLQGEYATAAQEAEELLQFLRREPDLKQYIAAAAALVRFAGVAEADSDGADSKPSQAAQTYRRLLGEVVREALALVDADVQDGEGEKQAGYYERYQLALCCLAAQDQTAYRSACAEMLNRFDLSENADEIHFTAWSCSLAPSAVDDYAPVIALARREVEARPSNAGALQTLGAALFRAGRLEEARQALTEADAATQSGRVDPAYAWYYLAMTNQWLGHSEKAKTWFDKATDRETAPAGDSTWNRRLTLELLRGEAAATLELP